MTYGYVVGLVLNLPRFYSRSALAVAQGVGLSNTPRDLPAGLFDGIAESSEEAQDMADRVNAERARNRARQMARRGLRGVMGQ